MKANNGAALLLLVSAVAIADPPASNAETTVIARNDYSSSMVELISQREPTAAPALVERSIAKTLASVNERLHAKIDTRHIVLFDSMFPAQ